MHLLSTSILLMDTMPDTDLFRKLVAIDNLWGTGGAAFLVIVLTNIFVSNHKYRLPISFFISFVIASIMVSLADLTGGIYNFIIILANAAIITSVAYAANDIAREKDSKIVDSNTNKKSGKMGGASIDNSNSPVSEKRFFKPWI